MISKLKSNKGMTLIEIIVAITILGIVVIGILGMYQLALSQIFTAGSRTEKVLDVQAIADDLIAENDIQKFNSSTEVSTYLSSKGYHPVLSLSSIEVRAIGYDVNYYVSSETTSGGVSGYEVTILKFTNNGRSSAEISTFIIKGGGI